MPSQCTSWLPPSLDARGELTQRQAWDMITGETAGLCWRRGVERRENDVWPCVHVLQQRSRTAAPTRVAVRHLRACVVCPPGLLHPTRCCTATPWGADAPPE